MGVKDLVGEDILMAEESINLACYAIAKIHNFEELTVYDTTSAKTVDGTQSYTLTTALGLTRPKDIISIVLYDNENSRKLGYRTSQWLDENYPYPTQMAEGRPEIYTQRVDCIELLPIPDAVYSLYITYAQWPLTLTADTDQCSYATLDMVIVPLARDIFLALRSGAPLDAITRARGYLDSSMRDDRSNPDALPVARGFTTVSGYGGEYWNDPFVKRVY
jgi:hypothetical protein